ncbi:Kinesin-like protein [Thalictrum thalictroides]|uniref:Kinesin-like protein n=1 Tax=Thalictrum thalictroides TaxID=46969 RepID=A0A7J6XFW9_THATH|nr:Kinesin-like protein [Thalictrum thalictroides]
MSTRFPGTPPTSKIDRDPGTPTASKIDRTPASTPGVPNTREEKIVVIVRLRLPLSKRERGHKDQVAWECVDDQTIIYKPPSQDCSIVSTSYTFDITLTALVVGVTTAVGREVFKGFKDLYFTNEALKKCKSAIEEIRKDPNVTAASVTFNESKQTVSINQTYKPSNDEDIKLLKK